MTFPETSQEERKAKPNKTKTKIGTIGHTKEGDNTCNLMKQQQKAIKGYQSIPLEIILHVCH